MPFIFVLAIINLAITIMKASTKRMATVVTLASLACLVAFANPAFAESNHGVGNGKGKGNLKHMTEPVPAAVKNQIKERNRDRDHDDDKKISSTTTYNMPKASNKFWNQFWPWFWFNHNGTTTPTVGNRAPVISGITAPTSLTINQSGTWTINASDPENSALTYSVKWGDEGFLHQMNALSVNNSFTQTTSFTHSYAYPGVYNVVFTVKDDKGATTVSKASVRVVTSTTTNQNGPVISGLNVYSVTNNSADILWATSRNADSKIYFSTSTPVAVGSSSTPFVYSATASLLHHLTLTGLNASTTYYFVVTSADGNNRTSTSSEMSFTTGTTADVTAPTISSITSSIGSTTATINWITNEASNSIVTYSTTTPVGVGATTVSSSTPVTSHQFNLTGLATSTTYYFTISSADGSNNTSTVTGNSFITASQ